ncbi:hypothetical protein MTR_7g077630 [Medicago truncatula]|uniref:Uncharacterized protein n=1 Tax=Medicago truncatula TaxID=3880 RepID=G7L4M7_MEDTR|nr:hypothetical protein MTR_7g077630 [Medicago truncatula]
MTSKPQVEIKSKSVCDAIKEYRSTFKIMQWDKVDKDGKYMLEGKVISGSNIGDKVFKPMLSLLPSDI